MPEEKGVQNTRSHTLDGTSEQDPGRSQQAANVSPHSQAFNGHYLPALPCVARDPVTSDQRLTRSSVMSPTPGRHGGAPSLAEELQLPARTPRSSWSLKMDEDEEEKLLHIVQFPGQEPSGTTPSGTTPVFQQQAVRGPLEQQKSKQGGGGGGICCQNCGKPCKGEALRVQNKHFHIKCFVCKGERGARVGGASSGSYLRRRARSSAQVLREDATLCGHRLLPV
ncbi:Actin-binding LIM protein 2 [Takifugu flavidus]|uniref:Actin-binding LIM protein 2 n=1 Tax=Takifugu flavidus TaxID=433684 RepID=A0A5C6N8G0_9TELE|nr:Actin-binding LIM protein 2 [Takifugu flavidus]